MKQKNTLSFRVTKITEKLLFGVIVYDTALESYGTDGETITIRGRPWKVGEKVDFVEINKRNSK